MTKIWFRDGGLPEKERPGPMSWWNGSARAADGLIDLVLLHCVTSPTWNQELRPQMDLLAKLRTGGPFAPTVFLSFTRSLDAVH